MQSRISLTESALLIVFTILSLALSCWLARYPRRTSVGILLGVLLGIILISAASALVAFVGYVVPLAQMDFWLMSAWSKIFG